MNDSHPDSRWARLSPNDLARWREIPTAVISDETGCAGVMSSAIRPVTAGRRFAGHAVTIRTAVEANGAPARVMDFLDPGDVIVVDGSAHPRTAVWGGNLIDALRRRSGAAVVVDGRVRDTAELRASGLAVFARDITPAGMVWGGEINVPIRCGGTDVDPGMLVVGDDDGVIVVPVEGSDEIMARCLARLEMEEAGRREDAGSHRTSMRSTDTKPAPSSEPIRE